MSASHDKLPDLSNVRLGRDAASRLSTLGLALGAIGLLATVGAMFSEGLRDQALGDYREAIRLRPEWKSELQPLIERMKK